MKHTPPKDGQGAEATSWETLLGTFVDRTSGLEFYCDHFLFLYASKRPEYAALRSRKPPRNWSRKIRFVLESVRTDEIFALDDGALTSLEADQIARELEIIWNRRNALLHGKPYYFEEIGDDLLVRCSRYQFDQHGMSEITYEFDKSWIRETIDSIQTYRSWFLLLHSVIERGSDVVQKELDEIRASQELLAKLKVDIQAKQRTKYT